MCSPLRALSLKRNNMLFLNNRKPHGKQPKQTERTENSKQWQREQKERELASHANMKIIAAL